MLRDVPIFLGSVPPAECITAIAVTLIIVILCIALRQTGLILQSVEVELKHLDQVRKKLRKASAPAYPPQPLTSAERMICHVSYLEAVQNELVSNRSKTVLDAQKPVKPRSSQEKLATDHSEDASTMSLTMILLDAVWQQRHVKVPDLAAIQGMIEEEAAQHLAPVRPSANLAMLLGLAGTVAGLTYTISALGPTISDSASGADPSKLLQEIAVPVKVLAFAFFSTLTGVMAAFAITLRASVVEARQNDLLNQLRRFSLVELAPNLFPDALEHQVELFLQGLAQSVSLLDSVSKEMQEAATILRQNLESHVDLLAEATTKTIDTLTEVTRFVKQSAEKLDDSVQRFDALQSAVHNTYTALMERHDSAQQKFAVRSGEVITAIENNQKAFNANATEIVGQLNHAVNRFDDSALKFQTAGGHFENMSQVIGREAYEAIATRADAFHASITRHEQATVLMESQLRELMSRLDPRLLPREEWTAVLTALQKVVTAYQEIEARDRHYQDALDRFGAIAAKTPAELLDLRNGFMEWLEPRLSNEKERRITLERLVASSDRIVTQIGNLQKWQESSLIDQSAQETQSKSLIALEDIKLQVIALKEQLADPTERQSDREGVNRGIESIKSEITAVVSAIRSIDDADAPHDMDEGFLLRMGVDKAVPPGNGGSLIASRAEMNNAPPLHDEETDLR